MSQSLVEKLKTIRQKEAEVQKLIAEASSEFKTYITDKNIPVLTRWKFFNETGNNFKNHQRYIPSFKSAGMKYIKDNFFDAPEVYGRGKTIYIKNIFEDLVYEDENGEMVIEAESFSMSYDEETNREALAGALEEIMSLNMASFAWDW